MATALQTKKNKVQHKSNISFVVTDIQKNGV